MKLWLDDIRTPLEGWTWAKTHDGALSEESDTRPGQPVEQREATILQSIPGLGLIVLAKLLAEGSDRCAGEITKVCAACAGSRR